MTYEATCPMCLYPHEFNTRKEADEFVKRIRAQLSAPAQPAQGWRLLEAGELIMRGDEWWDCDDSTWNKTILVGEKKGNDSPDIIRRRLFQPALPDAVRAVVEAAIELVRRHRLIEYDFQCNRNNNDVALAKYYDEHFDKFISAVDALTALGGQAGE